MTNRGIDAWIACGLLAAALAGCGGEAAPEPVEEPRVAVPSEPIPARPGTFQGLGVVLTGLAIRTEAGAVPEGDVSFSVTNEGARPYVFAVTGQGVDARTEPIRPGGTGLLNTSLRPGTYELHTIPEQEGPLPTEVRRTLTVTAGDAPAAP